MAFKFQNKIQSKRDANVCKWVCSLKWLQILPYFHFFSHSCLHHHLSSFVVAVLLSSPSSHYILSRSLPHFHVNQTTMNHHRTHHIFIYTCTLPSDFTFSRSTSFIMLWCKASKLIIAQDARSTWAEAK